MTDTLIIGIDPGAHGALAVMRSDGTIVQITDMPTIPVEIGSETINQIAPEQLLPFFGNIYTTLSPVHVFIEKPEGRPILSFNRATGKRMTSNPSAKRMLAMGENYGVVRGLCVAYGFNMNYLNPGAWKRAMGLTSGGSTKERKAESLRIARQLFPTWASSLTRQLDNDRAEAMLIALYGKRQLNGATQNG